MRLPLLLLLLLSHSAFSANTEALNAYTEEFAPYNYTEGKNFKGMANQIMDRIIEQSGLVINRESQPWLRAVQNAQNDPNSILFTTVRTPQRENQYLWVGPYDDCDIVFIKLKKRGDIKINSLKDAEKYMAGAARGAAGAQVLQSLGYNMNRLDTTSPEEFRSVKMLYANRFDLSAGMLMPHIYAAKQLNFDPSQLEAAFTIIKGGGCYFAFNPKVNQPAFQRFKDAFQALKQSGELDKIRQQYLYPTSAGQN